MGGAPGHGVGNGKGVYSGVEDLRHRRVMERGWGMEEGRSEIQEPREVWREYRDGPVKAVFYPY